MRIDIMEAIEICGYAIGTEAIEAVKKHYKKYGDWGRCKDIIISTMVAQNRENNRRDKAIVQLREGLSKMAQMEMFPYFSDDIFKTTWKFTDKTEKKQ